VGHRTGTAGRPLKVPESRAGIGVAEGVLDRLNSGTQNRMICPHAALTDDLARIFGRELDGLMLLLTLRE